MTNDRDQSDTRLEAESVDRGDRVGDEKAVGRRPRLRWLDLLRTPVADGEQERLRVHVAQAARILPPKGPLHGFVAQNPLQGLEHLPFNRAVLEAGRLLKGQGYLSNEGFLRIAASGRITRQDLERALAIVVPGHAGRPGVQVESRRVAARDVFLAHLMYGIDPLPHRSLRWTVCQAKATRRFRTGLPPETRAALLRRAGTDLQADLARLGEEWTVAQWLEVRTGLDLVPEIRRRIVNALRMPVEAGVSSSRSRNDRAPFWQTWRAARATLTRRISRTPREHGDRCLEDLGVPRPRRDGYLRRIDRSYAPLREAAGDPPVSREEFAAVWLHEERELLGTLVPRSLGTRGTLPAIARHFEGDLEAYAVTALWAAALAKLGLADPVSFGDREARAAETALHRALAVARGGVEGPDLRAPLPPEAYEALEGDLGEIGHAWSLGNFCQWLSGAGVTAKINDQMIRWCAAFLDEGLAGWPMPHREHGFYDAWRRIASNGLTGWFLGIRRWRRRVRRLPPDAGDVVIQCLRSMGIPEDHWTAYLTLHLAALPGWAGLVRWREGHPDYAPQAEHPIDLTQYLAVRLFYEMELVSALCRRLWGVEGTVSALRAYFRDNPGEYVARRRIAAGDLPDPLAGAIVRKEEGAVDLNWDALGSPGDAEIRKVSGLSRREQWDRFAEVLAAYRRATEEELHHVEEVCHDGWRLFNLGQVLGLSADEIRTLSAGDAKGLVELLDDLPSSAHGPVWLEAYEIHYRDRLFTHLSRTRRDPHQIGTHPMAQVIFCLDMREEGIRRHLEAEGDAYETLGTAGFFSMPIVYRPRAEGTGIESCPIVIKPRHTVAEEVRPGQEIREAHREHRTKWEDALHAIYHRLETNFVTAYPLIDILGVPFGAAVAGKTLLPHRWRTATEAAGGRFVPFVGTALRIARPTEAEGQEMLAAQERDMILEAVRRRGGGTLPDGFPPEAVEELRLAALAGDGQRRQSLAARLLGLSPPQELALIDELRRSGLDGRHRASRLAELLSIGFSPEEQADLVEGQLRMIGLTESFARLVAFCGHGATTENNPFATAYHCGACGGNRGGPNARTIAAMANSPTVRALLEGHGISIPADTHFLGAEHDTAADRIAYFDTEDIPATHREEFGRLQQALQRACGRHAQERCRRLPMAPARPTPEEALRHVETRSVDWAQVYPEWGHATCAAMVIGRRSLTRGVFLDRRVYLQSYDPDQDADGAVLEEIMAAFIPVVRGITLDYYFSFVDSGINGVFGSGTKALHNVVGLVGVMQGAGSDLKPGLPAQGVAPLHEPMRAQIIVDADPARVASIVARHRVLENVFKNQWAHLIAWHPTTGEFMRYRADGTWETLQSGEGLEGLSTQKG